MKIICKVCGKKEGNYAKGVCRNCYMNACMKKYYHKNSHKWKRYYKKKKDEDEK